MESTLSSPCSCPDPPLSRQGAAFAHLDSLPPYDLVLWTDGSAPFSFGKGSFAGFGSTILFSSYLTLVLSSSPSFFLLQSLWQIWQELSSLSSCSTRLQWVPGYSFLPGNDAADELARRRELLVPSVIPCSLSSLISRIHSCLFLDWRRTVSSRFFNAQVSSFSTEELVLPRHARCVLFRLRSNGHSLLLSFYLSRLADSRFLSAALADTIPGHLSSHSALSSYGIFAALTLWRLSVDFCSRPWVVARLLRLHLLQPCPHPSEGIR